MFSIIVGVGISGLQFVNLDSCRNQFITGFSIFMGIALPDWVKKNNKMLATGEQEKTYFLTFS